jgi:hypothetical protein
VANPRDGSFGRAFSFGTASAAEQRSIDAAAGAMILYLPVEFHTEARASRQMTWSGGGAKEFRQSAGIRRAKASFHLAKALTTAKPYGGGSTMAEGQPFTFTITFLTTFGTRLIDQISASKT